jgi:hypothetical protein
MISYIYVFTKYVLTKVAEVFLKQDRTGLYRTAGLEKLGRTEQNRTGLITYVAAKIKP